VPICVELLSALDYFAGAVAAGAGAVNSFIAFWTVYFKPQAVGTSTMIHAAAIISGDDFFTFVSSAIKSLL
jgi:hypothetical protein